MACEALTDLIYSSTQLTALTISIWSIICLVSAFTIKSVGFAGKKVYSLISDGTAEFNTAKKESIEF